jgi:hypothetical protein
MRIGRGNRSTRRKPALVPLCPPQTPYDLTWDRTRAAAVGSRRLIAWGMARPQLSFYVSTALVYLGHFFSFLIHTPSVGHLWRGNSPSRGRYLHTEQHRHIINAHRHLYLRVWTHDPSVRAVDRSLRPHGHCDRHWNSVSPPPKHRYPPIGIKQLFVTENATAWIFDSVKTSNLVQFFYRAHFTTGRCYSALRTHMSVFMCVSALWFSTSVLSLWSINVDMRSV